jgi:hypothetical protein
MMTKKELEFMILDKKRVKQKLREEVEWLESIREEFLMLKRLNTLTTFQFINHSRCHIPTIMLLLNKMKIMLKNQKQNFIKLRIRKRRRRKARIKTQIML